MPPVKAKPRLQPKPKPNKPKRTETDIQREILQALIFSGYMVWRNNSGAFWSQQRQAYIKVQGIGRINGVSDILGILPDGRMLAIEVKSPTGRLTPEQAEFILKVNNRNGVAFVARSLQDVQKAFRACPSQWPMPELPTTDRQKWEAEGWVHTG